MKLVSFTHGGSKPLFGVVEGDKVIVVSDDGWKGADTLGGVFADNALADVKAYAATAKTSVPLSEITYLAPVFDPPRIFCAGVNYEEHRLETGRDPSARPIIFTRTPQSHVAHNAPVVLNDSSEKIDYEGEIAIIIGKGGRRISADSAMDHIGAYSIYNDVSVRDWQMHTSQWIPGKNFDGMGGFGPWLVTPEDMPAQSEMRLTTRLNGEVMQDSSADMMIFSMAELIAYISTFTALLPGDVILTGTPGGVGVKRKPQVFMKAGDVCEVEVAGIGILSNPIA